MRLTRVLSLSVLLLMILGAVIPATAQDNTPLNISTAQTVRNASAAWDIAFRAGDTDELMQLYAEDAVTIPPARTIRQGSDAIREDFEYTFRTHETDYDSNIVNLMVNDDMAITVSEYTLALRTLDSGEEMVETGHRTVVREQNDDGEWKIVLAIWNTVEPS